MDDTTQRFDLKKYNEQASRELAEWLWWRRYMRTKYPQERWHAKYEGGAAIHIGKDGRFLGVW